METSELKEILDQHRLWLYAKGGKCAYFYRAKLTGAKLTRADLTRAYLHGANLTRADLFRANLRDAYLRDANLTGADLEGADLTNADIRGANLKDANLTDANLTGADLQYANLKGAILPDISWIIPGCLVQLNRIKYEFYLMKERKLENFVQDSFGFIVQNNPEEDTFDMLLGDRIIRGIPHWVKYSGMKQIATESV
jgi:hypothetical protein